MLIAIISLIYFILGIFKVSVDLNNFIATILSIFTVIISFGAYKHTQEQFRLNLLDKRYEIYGNLYDFFKFVNSNTNIYEKDMTPEAYYTMHDLVCKSFLGEGYHKSLALFGKDVEEFLGKVRMTYIYLRDNSPSGQNLREYTTNYVALREMQVELADIFRAYVYFGDHKNLDL